MKVGRGRNLPVQQSETGGSVRTLNVGASTFARFVGVSTIEQNVGVSTIARFVGVSTFELGKNLAVKNNVCFTWNREMRIGKFLFHVKHGFLSGREDKKGCFTWNGDFVSRGTRKNACFT